MIYNLSVSDKITNFADLLITLNGNEELFTLSENELKSINYETLYDENE